MKTLGTVLQEIRKITDHYGVEVIVISRRVTGRFDILINYNVGNIVTRLRKLPTVGKITFQCPGRI